MAIAPTRILKVVDADEAVTPTPAEPVRLVNKDGSTFGGGSVAWGDITGKPETFPVRKAAATNAITASEAAAPAALTSAAAVGAAPTKAEFDKVVADLTAMRTIIAQLVTLANASRTSTNSLIQNMRAAGLAESAES